MLALLECRSSLGLPDAIRVPLATIPVREARAERRPSVLVASDTGISGSGRSDVSG